LGRADSFVEKCAIDNIRFWRPLPMGGFSTVAALSGNLPTSASGVQGELTLDGDGGVDISACLEVETGQHYWSPPPPDSMIHHDRPVSTRVTNAWAYNLNSRPCVLKYTCLVIVTQVEVEGPTATVNMTVTYVPETASYSLYAPWDEARQAGTSLINAKIRYGSGYEEILSNSPIQVSIPAPITIVDTQSPALY
jgi:hypothetical protein